MQTYEERPSGQWVVVLFPQNKIKDYSDVRLFPTMDAATNRYAKATRTQHIYSSPGEMVHRHGGPVLHKFLVDLVEQYDRPAERYKTCEIGDGELIANTEIHSSKRTEVADELWRVCQLIGDKTLGIVSSGDDDDKFKIRIDRMTTPEGREIWSKFPKQARQIIEALITNAKSIMTESELQKLVAKLVADRVMKTKQDPWRIFAYYAPMFGDHALLYYPGKRHKLEDHEDNI